ncbi:hypothetical protein [Hydrogenophaga sp. BPS33]|uniref:hypothetical protein n=1 Tax=Hydrogenophaga sp. BPS33 TaxID=2651974 RepID=UPI0013200AE2|nr:hypothetical protein [Hydrogenophaga sp. BPS33]QHE87190.1 hypothetical protein F9K07_20945 [Hydrogenophaga sp. BPS33]
MATSNTRTFLDDAESHDAIIDTMPERERHEYRSYAALSLEAVFPNRVMVVYDLVGGRPLNPELLKFGDISVTRIQGPIFELECGGKHFDIGLTPTRWKGRDVFLHVPQNFIFKWKGKKTPDREVQFAPHYAVLIRTRSKEHLQVDQHTYCVTLNKFSERFPEVKLRY